MHIIYSQFRDFLAQKVYNINLSLNR